MKTKYYVVCFTLLIGCLIISWIRMRNGWISKPETRRFYTGQLVQTQGIRATSPYLDSILEENRGTTKETNSSDAERSAGKLSELIKTRLERLQDPLQKNCHAAKFLVCDMKAMGCGFGCQIHNFLYCFMVAYGLGRTFVLNSESWGEFSTSWTKYFRNITNTCLSDPSLRNPVKWETLKDLKDVERHKAVSLPPSPTNSPSPPFPAFSPLRVPLDLADDLDKLPGDPEVWLMSQFLRYIMRPKAKLAQEIALQKNKLGILGSYVAIHVRRTDEEVEAKYHNVSEYLKALDNHYFGIQKEKRPQNLYVATDDPTVIQELKNSSCKYKLFYDSNTIKSANDLSSRKFYKGFLGFILDIYFLFQADFLVCTHSSNMCRLAYELMYTHTLNAKTRVVSLDSDYFFWQPVRARTLVKAKFTRRSNTSDDMDIAANDIIEIQGVPTDSKFSGTNLRTSAFGWIRKEYVRPYFETVECPVHDV